MTSDRFPSSHGPVRRPSWIRRVPGVGALLLTAGILTAAGPGADGPALIREYCFECHGDGSRKGGFDLEALLQPGTLRENGRDWEKAWTLLRHGFMPPAGADMPDDARRQALADWIAGETLGVDFTRPDPGRVTIRRLNRIEYENSVHDLFGHDFAEEQSYSSDGAGARLRLRDRLPPDDTAFGFDNIGDFQTLPPGLLERYFDIAEHVVGQVVQDAPREPVQDLGRAVTATRSETGHRTVHAAEFEAGRAAEYRVDVQFQLGGWQEYGGAYDFALHLGGSRLAEDRVEVGGYKHYRYSQTVRLPAGRHTLEFTTDARSPDFKGRTNHLELRARVRVTGPLGAEFAEYPEPHRRIFHRGPAPGAPDERAAYAREILGRVATRAFRRPVDDETLDGLTRLALRGDTFERGVAQALTAILTSPRFFFRAETQPLPDDPASVHPIDEYALASRLSYLLWLSLPDDELLRLAGEGRLRENLRGQVRRMLEDPRSGRFFEDFPGQWLRTRNVLMTAISRDGDLNPVRGAMKRETEMLFEHIAREDRDLIELVTADYSFLNGPLARYYGIPDVEGDGFRKVSLAPETRRGGILTHGSFLVSTSNPNRTSPVKRGLFVLENLLAVQPPPPPPDVPPLDEDGASRGTAARTVREQLAAHRENKSCAACHAHFDPIGVVLENFDLVGRWRDSENGQPIEAAERAVTGETLKGVDDLRNLFASRKDRFYRGVTEKLLTYALGRGLEPADAVTVDRVAAAVAADGGRFSTLLDGIIGSPAFQMRRGDAGGTKDAPRLAIPPIPPPEKRRPQRRRNRPPEPPPALVEPAAVLPSASETVPTPAPSQP